MTFFEISCSEGEDDPWSDNSKEYVQENKTEMIVELQKKAKETIEKRKFRKRRPEQKRPYTYDLLRHNEEFRRIGINPVTSEFSEYLNSGNSDSQYTSQDSEDSHNVMTQSDSENENHNTYVTSTIKLSQNFDKTSEIKDTSQNSQDNTSDTSISSLNSYLFSTVPARQRSKIKHILKSSSDSDNEKEAFRYEQSYIDDISYYKRKFKGVLPPSYFTLENKFTTSHNYLEKHTSTKKLDIQENRKGLAKRKITKLSSSLKPFLTIFDNENLTKQSKETGNFNSFEDNKDNNYLSTESSDNNDVLEKNLNRMYSNTGILYNLDFSKKHQGNNIYKDSPKKSLEYRSLLKRRVKKKSNNYSQKFIKKKLPLTKIGILDIFKTYKDENQQIFPRFINLACRIMKSRKDLGRTYPYRKFFFFDNFNDRQEINEIFKKWRQGTLTRVYSRDDIFSSYVKPKFTVNSTNSQENYASILNKEYEMEKNIENCGRNSKKFIGKMLFQRAVQKKISSFIKEPNKYYHKQKNQKTRKIIDAFESIYDKLNKSSASEINIIEVNTDIENQIKDNNNSKPRRYHSIRKSIARRIDSNHFDDTIIHRNVANEIDMQRKKLNSPLQQSLKQFWLQKSVFSMTFNINPIKQDIFFSPETFIGNGLLQKLLSESNNSEESLSYIECYTMFDYKIQNNPPSDIKKIQKIFEELSCSVLEYNIQHSEKRDIINGSLYSFLIYLFRYITFWLKNDTSGILIDFSKNLLELCENLSEQLIPLIQISKDISLESAPVKFFFHLQMFFLVFAFKFTRLHFGKNDTCKFYNICDIIINTSKRLVRYLLQFGFDSLNSGLKKQNNSKHSLKGINNDDYLIEVWIVTIYIMDFSHVMFGQIVSNFWTLLNSELKITSSSEIYEFLDHEKCWYSIMNMIFLYQFDISGISKLPNGPDNWIIVEKILSNFFENSETYKKELGNSRDTYIRTLFGRCHYLISTWKWSYAKSIIILLYTFFSKRQLQNLANENTPGYPSFIQNLNTEPSTSVETYDTCFHIFLKLIILVINQLKMQLDHSLISSKDLRILISHITPLHNRKYSNDQELSIKDFISLENHHSLLLILFRILPSEYRPPIMMIQDLFPIENAHCEARLVNIKAWMHLMRFLLYNSNDDDFQIACNWYDLVLETTRKEYLSIYRTYKFQPEFQTLKYSNNKVLRYNLKQLENVMISCLRYKKQIVSTENNANKGKILQLFSKDCEGVSTVYNLNDFQSRDNIEYEFSMIINKTLSGQIFQMLSNYLGSDLEISYELLNAVIECWVLTADLLVRNGIKEWSNYLDYGQESWIRLGNSSKINQTGVIFMSKVIQECPEAYFAYRITFISYWFRVIVEDKLYNQHTLTNLILNLDSYNKLWKNPPFSKKSDFFEIQLFEMKLCQFSMISNTLANMGEIYSHLQSENLIQSTKSEFLTYLSNLFHSMRDNYQKLIQKNNINVEQYVDLCQKLIGCVLQYCGEFVNENSLPVLEWFTNSTNFPQPEEDVIYTAKKLKGYERKDLCNPLIQEELFRFIKAKCEIALFENKRTQFSTLICLILKETNDNNTTMHITYMAYSKSHITWIYIIPMLEATKDFLNDLLEYKYQNFHIYSIFNIMESFFEILLSCLKTFFESSTLLSIYGSIKIFEILAILVELLESSNYINCFKNADTYIVETKGIEHLWEYISKFLKLVPIFISWISLEKDNIHWPDLYVPEVQKKQLEIIQRQIYREWTLKSSQTDYIWLHNFRNQEIKLISGFTQEKVSYLKRFFISSVFSCGGVWELLLKEMIPSILLKGLSVDHNVIIEFMASIGKLDHSECLSNMFI
ncbi:hypothetical protein PCANB_001719 [Pneumocystis canis]|nr:hypothetical protein PCANB_001719 [Pneumocystis canis]